MSVAVIVGDRRFFIATTLVSLLIGTASGAIPVEEDLTTTQLEGAYFS
jgi:hypothetical protein